MIYLLPLLVSLCPPGEVCVEYEPPGSTYELQLAHIALLEARLDREDTVCGQELKLAQKREVVMTRQKRGLVTGLSITTTLAVSFLITSITLSANR